VYTKKTSSTILLTLLLISSLVALLPLSVAHATITGFPTLGVADHYATAPTAFTAEATSVDVIAGTPSVAPIATGCSGGVCPYSPSYFAISFSSVVFSGATFYLYMSENGLANINTTAGDIRYAGPFTASALSAAETSVVAGLAGGITGASYWIGNVGGGTIVGPIPVQISTAYQYVKVYDGSCGANPTFCGGTGVAGAKALVNVQPGITIDVVKGPAWTSVHVSGGGFHAHWNVNINYSFTYMAWETGAGSLKHGAVTTGIATGSGFFGPILMSMVDTGQAQNTPAGLLQSTAITLTAVNSTYYHPGGEALLNAAQNTVAPVIFTEFDRQFNQVSSYFSGTTVSVSHYAANAAADGNATCNTGGAPCAPAPKYSSSGAGVGPYVPGQPIQVYVTGTLGIVGSNFTIGGSVAIWLGGVLAGTVTASTSGHFVANVTVPKLPVGLNVAKAVANGVDYQFDINVNPTLILTPDSGPIGTTVTVTAYGFPANTHVSLWWSYKVSEDGNDYYLLNSTVDSTGSYNHTLTFVVPTAYGGAHEVQATTAKWPSPVAETSVVGAGYVTEATFTITPTLTVSPTSTPDNGTMIMVSGSGLYPGDNPGGLGCPTDESCQYAVNIDHAAYQPNGGAPDEPGSFHFAANNNGTFTLWIVAAGFRPGLHEIELMGPFGSCVSFGECETPYGTYMPTVYAIFNITTAGDPIADQFASLSTAISGLSTSMTAIQTSLTGVQSSLTSITSSLGAIQSSLSGITTTLNSVSTGVSGLSSTLTGISSSLSSIQGSLTTITGDVSGLGTQLTSIQQSATAIQSAASSLTTSVGNLGTQLTGMQSTLTSIQGSLTSIGANAQTAATQATTAATNAANAATNGSTAQTYVLVVAVLAAITLVLELAILVRKLS
jgi:prefoldin subunit 5